MKNGYHKSHGRKVCPYWLQQQIQISIWSHVQFSLTLIQDSSKGQSSICEHQTLLQIYQQGCDYWHSRQDRPVSMGFIHPMGHICMEQLPNWWHQHHSNYCSCWQIFSFPSWSQYSQCKYWPCPLPSTISCAVSTWCLSSCVLCLRQIKAFSLTLLYH